MDLSRIHHVYVTDNNVTGFAHFDRQGCLTVTSFTNLPVSARVNASATFWLKLSNFIQKQNLASVA